MFTNRLSSYFEQQQLRRISKMTTPFVGVPQQLVGSSHPFRATPALYRHAYECAKAELHNRLVALLRSRWDLIHLS